MKKRKSKKSFGGIIISILGYIFISALIIYFASMTSMHMAVPQKPFIENKGYYICEQVAKISGIVLVISFAIIIVIVMFSALYDKYQKKGIHLSIAILISTLLLVFFGYNISTISTNNKYYYETVEVVEIYEKTILVEYQDIDDLKLKKIKKPLMPFIKKGSKIAVKYKNEPGNMEYDHWEEYVRTGYFISLFLFFVFAIVIPIIILPRMNKNKKTIKNVEKK